MSLWTGIRDGLEKLAGPALSLIPGIGPMLSAGYSAASSAYNSLTSSPDATASGGNPDAVGSGYAEVAPSGSMTQLGDVNVSAKSQAPPWYSNPAWGAAGAGIAGTVGQQQTNSANAAEAQKNRDFQNQQTSTSWQRGVADMKAAGLNPMLAYSQGGASSGGGAQAVMGNSLGAGLGSAMQAAQTMGQVQNLQSQTENTRADTQNKLIASELLADQIRAGITRDTSSAKQADSQSAVLDASRSGVQSESSYLSGGLQNRLRLLDSTAQSAKYRLSGQRNDSTFEDSAVGRISRYTGYGLDTANATSAVLKPWASAQPRVTLHGDYHP